MANELPPGPEAPDVVTHCVDDALAPYRDLLPAEMLAVMAETLELFLTTHPVASEMVARLQQPAVVVKSGEVERGVPAAPAGARKRSGTEGA